MKNSHLAVGEVKVVTHFHRQWPPAAAAEVHDAILAASVRDIIDCKHLLTCRVALSETRRTEKVLSKISKSITTVGLGTGMRVLCDSCSVFCFVLCVFSPLWVWSCQCWGCCCPCSGSPVCGVSSHWPSPHGSAWRRTVTMVTATSAVCKQSSNRDSFIPLGYLTMSCCEFIHNNVWQKTDYE